MKHLFRRLCFLMAALFLFSAAAAAVNTSDAVESLDVDRPCSIQLTYETSMGMVSGLEVYAYRFAEVDAGGSYKPTGAFASYPIQINGITSPLEWDLLTNTLYGYVLADQIEPTATVMTDRDGVASFSRLPAGMYLFRRSMEDVGLNLSGFVPFIMSLPDLGPDGKWVYDRIALPKPGDEDDPGHGITPPEEGGGGDPGEDVYSVLKNWKDDGSPLRPKQVTVEIFCNGQSFKTVTLNAENLWSYSWGASGGEWTVVERNVPLGYTVSVEKNQTTFVITNALDITPGGDEDPEHDTPETPGGRDRTEYTVVKQWKDNDSASRPEQIPVSIFRSGVCTETVLLNEANGWAYSWSAEIDGAVWTVEETEVPAGYTVSTELSRGVFILTNTLEEVPGDDEPIRDVYTVLKQWKDDGSPLRPAQITVEILRSGVSVETVTLEEANGWAYSWSAPSDGAVWSVEERNVPLGYTASTEKDSTVFVITNTLDITPGGDDDPGHDTPEPPDPTPGGDPEVPYTGETSEMYVYILLLCASGIVLLLLGLTAKKKEKKEG